MLSQIASTVRAPTSKLHVILMLHLSLAIEVLSQVRPANFQDQRIETLVSLRLDSESRPSVYSDGLPVVPALREHDIELVAFDALQECCELRNGCWSDCF